MAGGRGTRRQDRNMAVAGPESSATCAAGHEPNMEGV